MKKIISMLLISVLVLSCMNLALAVTYVSVNVDGKRVSFPDAQPFIDENGRTQVPVRFVSEALGATVGWEGAERKVTVTRGTDVITLVIGEKKAVKNGTAHELDTAAIIKSDRTFVPLRFVSELLGATVKWNDSWKLVSIYTANSNTATGDTMTKTMNGYVVTNVEKGFDSLDAEGYGTVHTKTRMRVVSYNTSEDKTYPEISIMISLYYDGWQTAIDEAEVILIQKFDKELVNEIMSYIRKKTEPEIDLPLKVYDAKDKEIWVQAKMNSPINIKVYVK